MHHRRAEKLQHTKAERAEFLHLVIFSSKNKCLYITSVHIWGYEKKGLCFLCCTIPNFTTFCSEEGTTLDWKQRNGKATKLNPFEEYFALKMASNLQWKIPAPAIFCEQCVLSLRQPLCLACWIYSEFVIALREYSIMKSSKFSFRFMPGLILMCVSRLILQTSSPSYFPAMFFINEH